MSACFLEIYQSEKHLAMPWEERQKELVDQGYFFIVDELIEHLSKQMKTYFPTLMKIQKESSFYLDEQLDLRPSEISRLSEELQQLKQLLNFKTFLPEVKPQPYRDLLLNHRTMAELNAELELLLQFIYRAKSKRYWIKLTR